MRIRNVKPEFYRSDDIDALTWEQRYIFIALFSYVDDNGVGRDREVDICADLLAGDFSRDPGGTVQRVRECLLALVKQGLVVRYKVEGKPYLFVTGWDKHQYIKNPNREKHPRPDKALLQSGGDAGETLGRESGDATPDLPPVVGSELLVVGSESKEEKTSSPPSGVDAEFEGFWRVYPRKVGKVAARKAYVQARKIATVEQMRTGLQVLCRAYDGQSMNYMPHPATWLNQGRWDDDENSIRPPVVDTKQQSSNDMFARALERAQQRDQADQKALEA